MIDPLSFLETLKENSLNFYTGIPDSLLKNLLSAIDDNIENENHIITANEGSSVALAAGYYLAKSMVPVVYMQNSGLGNAINPLVSLTHSDVYSIPMLLIIGWRGEPGIKDEPQHKKQGMITEDMLRILDIPYYVVDAAADYRNLVSNILEKIKKNSSPGALLFKKNTFLDYPKKNESFEYSLSKDDAIKLICEKFKNNTIFVSTTGHISRELYRYRLDNKHRFSQDFLTVGSMGHASMIALGISKNTKKNVVCIDGDGALIMHMGNLTTIGSDNPKNFFHFLLNNGQHCSVGGQKTCSFDIDVENITKSSNYEKVVGNICDIKQLDNILSQIDFTKKQSTSFYEIKVSGDPEKKLPRPKDEPIVNKLNFMKFLND